MQKIGDLRDLFEEKLKMHYDGERRQNEALVILRAKASTSPLRQTIDDHIVKSKKQMLRMEDIFSLLFSQVNGEVNVGVKALIDEALELSGKCANEYIKEASIVGAIQRLNHHNLESYRTLTDFSEKLQMWGVQKLLQDSLETELLVDQDLSDLAEVCAKITSVQSNSLA